jgi:hypothetical protein
VQIKTILSFYLTPIRLAKIKNSGDNNPIKKWGSELNKEFSPEEYRMAKWIFFTLQKNVNSSL